jgi:Flp pilus assembly protein TadG
MYTFTEHVRRQREKGQALVVFLVLFPIFIMALFVAFDLGRYLVMRNQLRLAADSAAVAGAGALDMASADSGNFILHPAWAQQRAAAAFGKVSALNSAGWMSMALGSVQVSGKEITVTVSGYSTAVFGKYLGISGYSATVTSSARAATGITAEW